MPDALTLWSLAVVIGGLMYAAMSLSTRSTSTLVVRPVRRPGWIARRRARGGIVHRRDRVGVGYKSAVGAVHLSLRELAGHGLAVGGPKSGKTNFLQLLVEASAGQLPVVVVDPKGSPALEATVRAHGGQVWTLDGRLPVDLLDPRPWQVPDLLLEAEDYSADARAYRGAAHQRALWPAWALALQSAPAPAKLPRRPGPGWGYLEISPKMSNRLTARLAELSVGLPEGGEGRSAPLYADQFRDQPKVASTLLLKITCISA